MRLRLTPGRSDPGSFNLQVSMPPRQMGGNGTGGGALGNARIVLTHCILTMPDADHSTFVFILENLPPDADVLWSASAGETIGGLARPALVLTTTGDTIGTIAATVNGQAVDAIEFDTTAIEGCIFPQDG